MPRSPNQTQPQFDDVPLSAAPEEEHRPSNAVSAAALGEASPEETAQQHAAPEASTTVGDNPEATAPRHGSLLGRLWGPPSGSTDPEINAPPAEEQPFAAPPQESGEDLGWGVEDLGDDDDEGVWNDEPDTPSPHLETLTNYLMRHNPAKAGNAPRLLKEYAGREQELFANIERKYGEPVITTPPSMPPRVMSATMSNMENASTTTARPGDASTAYGDAARAVDDGERRRESVAQSVDAGARDECCRRGGVRREAVRGAARGEGRRGNVRRDRGRGGLFGAAAGPRRDGRIVWRRRGAFSGRGRVYCCSGRGGASGGVDGRDSAAC